jgi:predicted TIM-barrel fold metal-dependent hydrolase
MLDNAWTTESIRPLVLESIEAFGPERAMFASNFPVDKQYSSFVAVWSAFDAITVDFSAAERAGLFRENARKYYRIPA